MRKSRKYTILIFVFLMISGLTMSVCAEGNPYRIDGEDKVFTFDGQFVCFIGNKENYDISRMEILCSDEALVNQESILVDNSKYVVNLKPNVTIGPEKEVIAPFCPISFGKLVLSEGTELFQFEGGRKIDEFIMPSSLNTAFFWMSAVPDTIYLPNSNSIYQIYLKKGLLMITRTPNGLLEEEWKEIFLSDENPLADKQPQFVSYSGDGAHYILNSGYQLILRDPIKGDADADAKLNLKDVLLLRKYIAHENVSIYGENSDINDDSYIDMKDIYLIRLSLAHIN